MGVMLPFAKDGVRVATFTSTEVGPEGRKDLLDKYNSVSGSLTVLLMKPLDVFLSMLVAITFLCAATKFSIHHENRRGSLVMGVIGVVGYLMNSVFSALNMQWASGTIDPRISTSDLMLEIDYNDTQQLDADGLLTTTWDAKFRESTPGNSILNTIFRNLFVPSEDVPTWCNGSDWYTPPYKNVITNCGFPARTWQQYALSQAVQPTASMSILMNAADSDLPPDEGLPMNISIATTLVVYSMVVSNSFLGWWGVADEAWGANTDVNFSEKVDMAEHLNLTTRSTENATFISDVRKRVVDYYDKTKYASTVGELAKLEFTRVNLTETIVFDALTIEIPTQKYGVQEDNSSSTNPYYRNLYAETCNPKACLMVDYDEYTWDGNTTTVYPRVQALAICLNDAGGEELVVNFDYSKVGEFLQSCKQRSDKSIIIVSIGKRIEGDSFVTSPDDSRFSTVAVNARMVYSLTVGCLAWVPDNLEKTYSAVCEAHSGCIGIRYPLESAKNASSKDHLLVGEKGIPMSSLSPINMNVYWGTVGTSKWKVLASTVEESRGAALKYETKPALIVLPRNFNTKDAPSNSYTKNATWWECQVVIDNHLNRIEKNHQYIERTLQPAYTAGLFFIFQNAVVLKQLASNATTMYNKPSLQFMGNIQEMHIRASIPTTSILLALAGCIMMVLGGIAVAVLSKQGEREFLEHGTAGTATEALSNRDKFPPFMLRVQLRDAATGNLVDVSMNSVCVENMVLVSEADKSERFVVCGNSVSNPEVDRVKPYPRNAIPLDEACEDAPLQKTVNVRSTEVV